MKYALSLLIMMTLLGATPFAVHADPAALVVPDLCWNRPRGIGNGTFEVTADTSMMNMSQLVNLFNLVSLNFEKTQFPMVDGLMRNDSPSATDVGMFINLDATNSTFARYENADGIRNDVNSLIRNMMQIPGVTVGCAPIAAD